LEVAIAEVALLLLLLLLELLPELLPELLLLSSLPMESLEGRRLV
jgi:hypothetical protein